MPSQREAVIEYLRDNLALHMGDHTAYERLADGILALPVDPPLADAERVRYERLKSMVAEVISRIENKGRVPWYHDRAERRSRAAFPHLWEAIDALRKTPL